MTATTVDFLVSGSSPSAAGQVIVSTAGTGAKATAQWGTTAGGRIYTQGAAVQTQVMVAATKYYVTGSGILVPSTVGVGPVVGSKMKWRIVISKTAAGTGNWSFLVLAGTNGTVADTALLNFATTQTAAIDTAVVDIAATFTAVGASATLYTTLTSVHDAAAAAGFGFPLAPASVASGTSSTFNSGTASLYYGIAVASAVGTPTFTVTEVDAEARGIF